MSSTFDRLCLVTPDTFYAVLLKDAQFPTFESTVIRGVEQLPSLAGSFMPDVFVLFAAHLGSFAVSSTVIELRSKFPKAYLFEISGVRDPKLHLIWAPQKRHANSPRAFEATSVEMIDAAIRQVTGPRLAEAARAASPTPRQLEVLRLISAGLSSSEIAAVRKTTVRVVDALVGRALDRIWAGEAKGARAKMLLAQKYLASTLHSETGSE